MPFQRRGSCIFHWRGWAWLSIWDRVKIPQYSHRLIHRKRVTWELRDSHFRLMTIKHAIPKIEWAIELLYNSVKTGSQSVWRSECLETRCGRESQHPAEGALRTPIEQFGDRIFWRQDACTQQRAGPPGLRLSIPWERERHNADGYKSGGQLCCSSVRSPTPSHTQPLQIK